MKKGKKCWKKNVGEKTGQMLAEDFFIVLPRTVFNYTKSPC